MYIKSQRSLLEKKEKIINYYGNYFNGVNGLFKYFVKRGIIKLIIIV